MDRFRERIPFFHGDDARTTIIGRSNRATFAMKKLSEWKETGGGSHASGHARRSASSTIYLKARRFPFARYDPTQCCTYDDYLVDYPSVHTITSTREPHEQESNERTGSDQEKLRLMTPIYMNETNRLLLLLNNVALSFHFLILFLLLFF